MSAGHRLVSHLQGFFASWRFPALVLSVLLSFKALALLVLAVPPAPSGFAAFAEEFKIWCFGYDPAKGTLETAYVGLTLAEPLVLGLVIVGVWWRPLRQVLREQPRAVVPYLLAAVVIVGGGSGALFAMRGQPKDAQPFPARALRLSLKAPSFALSDQDGAPVSIDALRGRVVVLTGIYASCRSTCPMILAEAKRAMGSLTPEERSDVTVVAVTLDPARDTKESLAQMARAQGVGAPSFHLAWGSADDVERALDDLSLPRTRNPETGAIDHANVFVLVDRGGRIAYRLALSAVHEPWLLNAMRLLVHEPALSGV